MDRIDQDADLKNVVRAVTCGTFSPDEPTRYTHLLHNDYYQSLADFRSYVQAQERVDQHYRDTTAWTTSMIVNIAQMGYFSSDRAISEYAEDIWRIPAMGEIPELFVDEA